MTFREELRFGPHSGDSYQNRTVVLTTTSPSSHMNIYPKGTGGGECWCLSPAQAKQLRDVLLKAYPIETAQPSKFKAGDKVSYVTTVGYGLRGMAGRKGTIRAALADEWYEVVFTGGPFDNLIKVHSSFLEAQPEQQTAPQPARVSGEYKAGDLVRRTGSSFRGVQAGGVYEVVSVNRNHVSLKGFAGTFSRAKFELVASAPAQAQVEPQTGRYIIHVLDGHRYLPGSNPKVHLTASAAEAEAQRLAKEHGGTYHVFRAAFEASREKPVVPPLKTTKL